MDVVILGMNYGETSSLAELKEYVKSKDIHFPILLNAESLASKYNILSIPTLYVIDKYGKIVFHCNGYSKENEKNLYYAIMNNLKE